MTTTPHLSRSARLKAEHYQEIFKAAQELITTQGLESLTMESIAKHADFAKGTLYNYFQSKKMLITALLKNKMDQLFNQLQPIIKKNTPFDTKLKQYITTILNFVQTNKTWMHVFFTTTCPNTSQKNPELAAHHQKLFDCLHLIIKEGIAKKTIKPINLPFLSNLLFCMIYGTIIKPVWKNSLNEQTETIDINKKTKWLIDLFLNGVKKETKK